MNEKGYTLSELMIVLVILGVLIFLGGTIYVVWHFISKWW